MCCVRRRAIAWRSDRRTDRTTRPRYLARRLPRRYRRISSYAVRTVSNDIMSVRQTRSLSAAALLTALITAAAPMSASAQTPMDRMAEVRREINAGNAVRALSLLDTIAAAVPGHPNVPYLRAHALGRAGRMPEAENEIRTLLRRDARYAQAALRDSSVMSLRGDFPDVDARAAAAATPVNRATMWATCAKSPVLSR